MTLLTRILVRWLPFAFLATACCALAYLVAQQIGRRSADEPQVQIARDVAAGLAGGKPIDAVVPAGQVDLGQSLALFVMVLDDSGAVRRASGVLNGRPPAVPAGVLEHVRQSGEERVTWQPDPGVRLATVIVRRVDAGGGFVVSGRSLRETEERIQGIQTIVGVVWVVTVAGLLALVAGGEYVLERRRRELFP